MNLTIFLSSIGVMFFGVGCCAYSTWSLMRRPFEKEAHVVGLVLITVGFLGAWLPIAKEVFID